jgi:hypothetical protein
MHKRHDHGAQVRVVVVPGSPGVRRAWRSLAEAGLQTRARGPCALPPQSQLRWQAACIVQCFRPPCGRTGPSLGQPQPSAPAATVHSPSKTAPAQHVKWKRLFIAAYRAHRPPTSIQTSIIRLPRIPLHTCGGGGVSAAPRQCYPRPRRRGPCLDHTVAATAQTRSTCPTPTGPPRNAAQPMHTQSECERERDRQERERERDREKDRETEKERKRKRETERGTERERERDTQIHRNTRGSVCIRRCQGCMWPLQLWRCCYSPLSHSDTMTYDSHSLALLHIQIETAQHRRIGPARIRKVDPHKPHGTAWRLGLDIHTHTRTHAHTHTHTHTHTDTHTDTHTHRHTDTHTHTHTQTHTRPPSSVANIQSRSRACVCVCVCM